MKTMHNARCLPKEIHSKHWPLTTKLTSKSVFHPTYKAKPHTDLYL
jgi:hypothetical protein